MTTCEQCGLASDEEDEFMTCDWCGQITCVACINSVGCGFLCDECTNTKG